MTHSIKNPFSRLSTRHVIKSDIRAEEHGNNDRYKCHEAHSKKILFEEIVHHDTVKRIFIKALISNRPIHILLAGDPGSAKSMFLNEILRSFKSSLFVVGSNSTKAGLINQLFEKSPEYLLIDELDKMNNADQTLLLNVMETGLVSETKVNKTRALEMNIRVFATANYSSKIIDPLLSRFVVLQLPEYTFEEFREIGLSKLEQTKLSNETANAIIKQVWYVLESRDIRDVVKIGNLVTAPADVPFIVRMMKKAQFGKT